MVFIAIKVVIRTPALCVIYHVLTYKHTRKNWQTHTHIHAILLGARPQKPVCWC